jgi:hypothetical protein
MSVINILDIIIDRQTIFPSCESRIPGRDNFTAVIISRGIKVLAGIRPLIGEGSGLGDVDS